jgi:hypothetical protein
MMSISIGFRVLAQHCFDPLQRLIVQSRSETLEDIYLIIGGYNVGVVSVVV